MTARHRDTTVPLGCSRLPQSPDGGRHRVGRLDADGELILSLREALDRSLAATRAATDRGIAAARALEQHPSTGQLGSWSGVRSSTSIRWYDGWRFFGDADPSVGREMQVGDGWTNKAGVTHYWTEQGWS